MDYHVHIDYGEDEETHTVRVTEEGEAKVLLKFEFKHPINSKLVKDARREALKRLQD
jgi:hypothetical protein